MANNTKISSTRQALADQFVAALEQEKLPWMQPWVSNTQGPMEIRNAISNRRYNGVNAVYLWLTAINKGYEDPRWATYKQCYDHGWHVRRGEHGTPVEYWMMYDTVNKKSLSLDEARKIILDEPNREEDFRLYAKTFTVFNAAQIEGIPALPELSLDDPNPEYVNEVAAEFWQRYLTNENITLEEGSRAYYTPATDSITLPPKSRFVSEEAYYDSAFHEAAHSTAEVGRLNRLVKYTEKEGRAFEELVAEIGGAFTMSAVFGEASQQIRENNVAYIQSWAEDIKKDPNIVARAIQQAEGAANYLLEHGELSRIILTKQEEQNALFADDVELPHDVKSVTNEEALSIIENRTPLGLFLLEGDGKYTGIDNRTGDAWTEDFPRKDECIAWLQEDFENRIGIVARYQSELNMDPGYVNSIVILHEEDGYHNHFLYDEDKGKGAAGSGPFATLEEARQDLLAHYPDVKSVDKVQLENGPFNSTSFEERLPYPMRFKLYEIVNENELYWVTQEPFAVDDLKFFQEAVKAYSGTISKAYVTYRGLSGYNCQEDWERCVLAEVTADSIVADGYIQAMEDKGMDEYLYPQERETARAEANVTDLNEIDEPDYMGQQKIAEQEELLRRGAEIRALKAGIRSDFETLATLYKEDRLNEDRTPEETVKALIDVLGQDRAMQTVANLVNCVGDWDGRVFPSTRAWAASVEGSLSPEQLGNYNIYAPSEIHPAHINQLGSAAERLEAQSRSEHRGIAGFVEWRQGQMTTDVDERDEERGEER